MSKTKQTAFRIITVLLVLLISFFAAETLLRLIGFSYHLYPEKIKFGWPNIEEKDGVFTSDPDLFWVPNKPKTYQQILAETKSNKPKIITMGCSNTQFTTYSDHLEKNLQEKNSVANLGVGGWTTYQGLQQLKRDIIPLKPKIVTILYGWNDHWIGFGIEDKKIQKLNHSLLYKMQSSRLVQLLTYWLTHKKNIKPERFPNRVSPEDFEKNLIEMITIARDNNIIPVLITAPTSHHALENLQNQKYLQTRWMRDINELVPIHKQYVEIVRNVAARENAILCDLYEKFNRLPKQELIENYMLKDGIHFTEQGSEKAAEHLYETIQKIN